jgi:hypothetical protein
MGPGHFSGKIGRVIVGHNITKIFNQNKLVRLSKLNRKARFKNCKQLFEYERFHSYLDIWWSKF